MGNNSSPRAWRALADLRVLWLGQKYCFSQYNSRARRQAIYQISLGSGRRISGTDRTLLWGVTFQVRKGFFVLNGQVGSYKVSLTQAADLLAPSRAEV